MTASAPKSHAVPQEVVDRLVEASAHSAVFMLDRDGRVSSWNDGAVRMFGYASKAIQGEHVRCLYTAEEAEAKAPERLMDEAAANGQAREEGWRVRSDGSRFWSLTSLTTLHDDTGELTGFAKVTQDFTERHLTEEQLRAAQRRMALLGTVVTDANFGDDPVEVTRRAGVHICQAMGFEMGHFFFVEEDGKGGRVLRSGECFPDKGLGWEEFLAATRTISIRPGEGLAGGVVGAPLPRVSELTSEAGFIRHEAAAAAGLRWGVAVPVLAEDRVVAVLECFSRRRGEATPEFLEVLTLIGTSLGRVFERAAYRKLDRAIALRRHELVESEREELARELHEEVGQVLTGVRLQLETLRQESRDREVTGRLEEGIGAVESAISQIRDLSYGLRPATLEELGVAPSLRALAAATTRESGVPVDFVEDGCQEPLSPARAIACYRVVQEALRNAVRHARASRIAIRVSCAVGEARVTVDDDGVGFHVPGALDGDRTSGALGLFEMRERAELLGGTLQVTSEPGHGTRIVMTLPARGAS